MKRIIAMVFAVALLLTGCGQIGEDTGTKASDTDLQSSVSETIDTGISESGNSNDGEPSSQSGAAGEYEHIDVSDNEPIEDMGEAYYKEVSEEDILFDEEYGVKYAKNQLLISVFPETEKNEVQKIVDEIEADIVGVIELTGDYQIEFHDDKTLDELDAIADYINSYPFVMNVTLNIISEVTFADATKNDYNAEEENDNVKSTSKE